jgi:diaminohydroxyphosphoribosylaminopyrimidine deaminase / 5-amino-6-(5-phosphoribosylamino)uracil reductase
MRSCFPLTVRDNVKESDSPWMRRCLDLARLGIPQTRTNPMVGAVLVKDNKILSEGYHQSYGGPHAEVNAIVPVSDQDLRDTTLYVSLEPCSHQGKTPPCADLIIDHQIGRCRISVIDPNPRVSGSGLARLKNNGVEVTTGICQKPGETLLAHFIIQQKFHRPYVILKWAQTRDGYLGKPGQQFKISNSLSDRLVHKWRSESDGIMAGSQTVVVDDPHLGNRLFYGSGPARIILDRKGSIPPEAKIWKAAEPVYLFTSAGTSSVNHPGVRKIELEAQVEPLASILATLYKLNIGTVLVEGGPTLHQSFIQQDLWDETRVITSPGILGGGLPAPLLPGQPVQKFHLAGDQISIHRRIR